MDFVSHALWGGIAFGRRTRKIFLTATGISLLPDVLTEGLFAVLLVLNIGGMPGWGEGHPDITAYPLWAQNFYNFTHSLVVFTLAFFLIWVFVRKSVWVVGAWGLHILIDIPTHSIELFPTPFLWPLSDFKIDGVGWHNPIVFAANVLLLLGAYSLWLGRKNRNKDSPRRQGLRDANDINRKETGYR
ncbi:MAG TPA: hypothetical protein VMW42_04690 [Desulfatiglandales bacterium]|nr:hypothetical protein [Desulfatiglandales bacterium]